MLSCRLAWKGETQTLGPLVILVNRLIIAFRLAGEVTVNDSGNEKPLALGTLLHLLIYRTHLISHESLIFFTGLEPCLNCH